MDLKQFKETLFERGARLGFTEMELYYQSSSELEISAFKGEVDEYSLSVDGGVSFRGLHGGHMGYSYSEKIDPAVIDHLLEGARAGASATDSTSPQPIFAGSPDYPAPELYNAELESVTPDQLIELAKGLDREAYAADSRISLVNGARTGIVRMERMIANTRGLDQSEVRNLAYAFVMAVARDGSETKSGMDVKQTRRFSEIDHAALARKAAGKAVSYLGAGPVPSGSYTVILENRAAANLLQAFAGAFSAENVQRGRSRLKGKLGEQVAGGNIDMIDDPLRPDGLASRAFDAEGVASRRLALIEGGVLRSYLHSLKTAAADGAEPTGHGSKQSYKGSVSVAPSNLYLEPGMLTFDDLVGSTGEAVLITSLQGLHSGTNAVSGAFSLAAHGYYVKGGQIERPVNQITVAGNFFDLLSQIDALAGDLEFSHGFGAGSCGSPTLRVRGLTIGGT